MTIEFLIDEPSFQPHHLPFIRNLATLGIDATLRIVDPVQFRARMDSFDFDITVQRFSFSSTPGDSLRTYFSSQAAATKGSQNLAGIAEPAVDRLIDVIIAAKTREELVTACRALDRVIRAGRYWIPHWYKGVVLDRLLGRIRLAGQASALFSRHPGNLVVRCGQGRQTGTKGLKFHHHTDRSFCPRRCELGV